MSWNNCWQHVVNNAHWLLVMQPTLTKSTTCHNRQILTIDKSEQSTTYCNRQLVVNQIKYAEPTTQCNSRDSCNRQHVATTISPFMQQSCAQHIVLCTSTIKTIYTCVSIVHYQCWMSFTVKAWILNLLKFNSLHATIENIKSFSKLTPIFPKPTQRTDQIVAALNCWSLST